MTQHEQSLGAFRSESGEQIYPPAVRPLTEISVAFLSPASSNRQPFTILACEHAGTIDENFRIRFSDFALVLLFHLCSLGAVRISGCSRAKMDVYMEIPSELTDVAKKQ